jgi:hypothetical protein
MNLKGKNHFILLVILFFTLTSCAEFKDIFERSYNSPSQKKSSPNSEVYVYHTVSKGESFKSIGKDYKVAPDKIKKLNGYDSNDKLLVGDELIIPTTQGNKKKVAKKNNSKSKVSHQKGKYIWPAQGKFSSGFGKRGSRMHDGIDISAPKGTVVIASRTGKVIHSGKLSGYGNMVVLKHGNDYFTAYAHLTKIYVKKGEIIKQGKKVGTVGNTGRSSGPHLHFEIRYKTKPVDPLKFLPKRK